MRAEPGATEVGVQGCGGHFPAAGTDGGDGATELFLGNAGTAMRPLTAAVAAAAQGTFVLDGIPRMREPVCLQCECVVCTRLGSSVTPSTVCAQSYVRSSSAIVSRTER